MITKLNPEVIAESSITADKLDIESLKTDSGFVTEDSLSNKINGKGLSTEDFTTELKTKLEGLGNFDDTELSNALSTLRSDFDKLVSGDTTTAIKTFNEVIAFLDGLTDTQDLSSIIASIEQQIASKADDSLALHKAGDETITGVKTFNGRVNFLGSGDSNAMYLSTNTRLNVNGTTNTVLGFSSGTFLINNAAYNLTLRGKGTRPNYNNVTLALSSDIPAAVTESTVSGWGFTKNTGTYSKPSTGIPKSDLASAVQTSLGKADTALQSYTEQYKGTITGVSANGTSVATSGVANIPAASTRAYGVTKLSSATNSTSTTLAATASAVKAAYDLANGKQDKLVSGTNIKTVNGTSILGSGDITISGGSSDANVQAVDTGDVLDDVNVEYATTAYVDNKVANISLTDYATIAYVDGLVGDINSVLEEIINGGPALITFTVGGKECQAEEGMTFYEWAISDYYNENVNMYSVHNTTISIREYCINNGDTGCGLCASSGMHYSGITTSTIIQDGGEYVVSSSGFPM